MKIGNYLNIGQPIDVTNKGIKIYPLYYQGVHAREYRLIEEVEDKVGLTDSGRVSNIYIRNRSKYPVFIRAGTILKGNTQNRGIKRSIVAFPIGKKREYENIEYTKVAEVYCVHQTSPISSSGSLTVNCLMPHNFEALAYSGASQGKMWNDVKYYASTSGAPTGYASGDDLTGNVSYNIAKYESTVDKIINKNPEIMDAVGIAIVDTANVLSIELYDSQESWNVMCRKILNKYSTDFAKRTSGYSTGNYWKGIPNKIKGVLNSIFKVLAKYSDSARIDGKHWIATTYQGNLQSTFEAEMTKLNKKVIHLAVVRGTKFITQDKGPISIIY